MISVTSLKITLLRLTVNWLLLHLCVYNMVRSPGVSEVAFKEFRCEVMLYKLLCSLCDGHTPCCQRLWSLQWLILPPVFPSKYFAQITLHTVIYHSLYPVYGSHIGDPSGCEHTQKLALVPVPFPNCHEIKPGSLETRKSNSTLYMLYRYQLASQVNGLSVNLIM